MLKLKMMLCVTMLPLVVVDGIISSSLSVSIATKRLAWIMQLSDWQTPLNGIISPRERLTTMQKQLEGTQKYINEQADRVAHIDGHPCNYCEQYTRASSGV